MNCISLSLSLTRSPSVFQMHVVEQAKKVNLNAPHNAAVLSAVLRSFDVGDGPRLSGSDILALVKAKY